MAVPIYNEQTTADVRLRLMQTLDGSFAAVRSTVDAADQESAMQLLNGIRSTMYGIVPAQFTRGVIFGLDVCTLDEVPLTWGLGEGPGVPPGVQVGQPLWGEADQPWDYVVTRGNLFDGTRIVNLEPTDGRCYVHKLRLPWNLTTEDCYAFGGVFYRTTTGQFQTLLLGQMGPYDQPVLLDRSSAELEHLVDISLGEGVANGVFHVTPPADGILVARVLFDIDSVVDGVGEYEVHAATTRRTYPFSAGQPLPIFMEFGAALEGALARAGEVGYDVALVYPLLDQVVRAALWGASFYAYWVADGRLPANVKYYYNAIYSPPIP